MGKQCTHLFIPFFLYTLLLMVLAPYIGIGVPPIIKGPGPIQPTEPAATRPVPSSATIAFGRFRLLLDIFGLFCLLKYSLSLSRAFLKAALPLIIQRYIDFYSVLDPTSQYGQFILFPQTTAVRPENSTVDNDRHGAMSLDESTIDCGGELSDLGNISSGDTKRLDKSALDVTAVSLSSSFSSSTGADIDDASNVLGRNVSLVLTPKVALPNTGKPYSPLTAEHEARRKFVTEALEPYRRHVPDVGSPISADLIAKSDLSLNPNKGLLNTKWLENIREIKFKIPTPLHVEEREGSVTPKAQDLRRQSPLNTDPPSSSLPRDTRVVTSLDAQPLIPETKAIAYENGLNGPGLTRAISVKDQSFAMSRPSDLDAELSGSY